MKPVMRRVARVLVLLSLIAALTHVGSVPAQAARPVHDSLSNAKVIDGLPYTDQADTREATAGKAGRAAECGNNMSVWYQYTPRRDRAVEFDTANSDYRAYITVFTRTADGLELYYEPCSSAGAVDLEAGVTYAIMVSACCGDGGDLVFRARTALNPTVDLDAEGTVSEASGVATVTGTLTCNRRTASFAVEMTMRQRISDTVLAYGVGQTYGGVCTRRAPIRFSVVIDPAFGSAPFKADNAGVRLESSVCDDVFCASAPVLRDIVLLRWVT